jgi:hypothetical protein
VTRLHEWTFETEKGLPLLFRRDFVVPYDEIRVVRAGAVVVSRSERTLFSLAAGEIPPAWRVPVPPELPAAATPPEARQLVAELAAPRPARTSRPPATAPVPPAGDRSVPADEEDDYAQPRGVAPGLPPQR